jgi:hypothetical protein
MMSVGGKVPPPRNDKNFGKSDPPNVEACQPETGDLRVRGVRLDVKENSKRVGVWLPGPKNESCEFCLVSCNGTPPNQGDRHAVPGLRMLLGEDDGNADLSGPDDKTSQPFNVHALLPAGTQGKITCTHDHVSRLVGASCLSWCGEVRKRPASYPRP